MKSGILYHEGLNFVRRGSATAIIALLIVTFAYVGWSGDRWRDARHTSLTNFETQGLEAVSKLRADLAEIEAGRMEATPRGPNALTIQFPAVLPPSSLADFAVGHADLHPASAEISIWRNLSDVFGRYQFDNPTTLSVSTFDVAVVVIVLMPLLMIAASFDVLASERSRASLAMVLASPVRLTELVWTRLAFRNVLIWLVAVLAMLVLAFWNDAGGDRFARLGLWIGASLLYGLVWSALIAYCVARCKTATGTAGALVGLWLFFTLAMPATIATLSEAVYPTPSRLAFLSEVRSSQGESRRNLEKLTEGFLLDHPELTVGDENVPASWRAAFLANQTARKNTQPIVAAYDAARAGRERTIAWAQYLSPSIIAQRLLYLSAGGNLERQHRFQAQVQASMIELDRVLGPAIVAQQKLSAADLGVLKPFEFKDISVQRIFSAAIAPGIFLLLLSLFLGIAAHRRLVNELL